MPWFLIFSLATASPAPRPPPSAVPGFVDGGGLNALCNPADADADAATASSLCLAYVVGSVDQLLARQARRTAAQRTICLPDGLLAEQLAAAVAGRLAHRPQVRFQAASAAVRDALEEIYPCRSKADVSRR